MSMPFEVITEHLDIWSAAIKNKSAAGRGTSKKIELYGIKKLRELILDLAVRGLLVPQDPNDEPASAFLKRVLKEKKKNEGTRVIEDAKVKSSAKHSLPPKWISVKLGDVINFVNGFAFKSNTFSDTGVGIVKIGDIQNGQIDPAVMSRVDNSEVANLNKNLKVLKGDLVIAMSGATTGKLGFNLTDEIFYLNQRVGKIEPYLINKNYLYYVLSTMIQENLAKSMGSAIPNLSTNQIKMIELAIPPQSEQARIVAKIENLMTLCDQLEQQQESSIKAHETLVQTLLTALTNAGEKGDFDSAWSRIIENFDLLFKTEDSIDQLKATILQLAVMGKLVPQNPNDEPASDLLHRIVTEKERLGFLKIMKNQDTTELLPNNIPFKIPTSWKWEQLGNLGICSTGKTPSTKIEEYFEGTIPFIGPGEITASGKFLPSDKNISEEGLKHSTEANDGDILMVCIGGSIGKSIICNKRIAFNQQINAIRPIYINSKFLNYAISCKYFLKSVLENATGSATPIINRSRWERLLVPVAPLEEQYRIVAKINELMALCDKLKSKISTTKSTATSLADSVTSKIVQ